MADFSAPVPCWVYGPHNRAWYGRCLMHLFSRWTAAVHSNVGDGAGDGRASFSRWSSPGPCSLPLAAETTVMPTANTQSQLWRLKAQPELPWRYLETLVLAAAGAFRSNRLDTIISHTPRQTKDPTGPFPAATAYHATDILWNHHGVQWSLPSELQKKIWLGGN